MLKLFLTFLKINFLCTSGPASIGLTKQLTVPGIVSEDKFSEIVAIASSVPGSDAMQMAWQIGYTSKGILGAAVATIAALIPTIVLLAAIYFSTSFINTKVLQQFFEGVKPALAVLLMFTAFGLASINNLSFQVIIAILACCLMLLKAPIAAVMLVCGIVGMVIR